MKQFSYFCTWARSDPKSAAKAFLHAVDEQTVTLLLDAASWKDADVLDFERRKLSVLIDGRWGRFWLASPWLWNKTLLPPAPRVAPSNIVALARAVSDTLLAGWEPKQGVA